MHLVWRIDTVTQDDDTTPSDVMSQSQKGKDSTSIPDFRAAFPHRDW